MKSPLRPVAIPRNLPPSIAVYLTLDVASSVIESMRALNHV